MARVKSGVKHMRKRKRVLKMAKGFYGTRHTLFRTATEAVDKALQYAYRDRKAKKRDFRKLWIIRISAACKALDCSYSRFIDGLKKKDVKLDRRVLAELCIKDEAAFKNLVDFSRS